MRHPPDWVTLRIFLAAYETGNVARAAERCAIAPSAAAKRIQDLELLLDLQLFVRAARGVIPTEAGTEFAAAARETVEMGNRLLRCCERFRTGGEVTVRLDAATSAIAGHDLGGSLAGFDAAERRIRIDLHEETSASIVRNIADGTTELGVTTLRDKLPADMRSEPWRHDSLSAVLPSDHRLAGRQALSFADVVDERLIGIVPNDTLALALAEAAARLGKRLVLGFRVATAEAAIHLVALGHGVSIMPDCLVQPRHRETQAITTIPLHEDWAHRTLYLIGRNRSNMTPAASSLWDHLLAGGA